jgi:hypothetical protein
VETDRSPLRAELDRVGASFAKAGTRDYISVQSGVDEVKLLGPPREHPRRSWLGPEWQAVELLRALPDDAGVQAVWRALNNHLEPLTPANRLDVHRGTPQGLSWGPRLRQAISWLQTGGRTGSSMRQMMSRRALSAVLVAAAVALVAGGIAYASIPDAGVIHGCYLKSGGGLRVIDSGASCRSSETSLNWNQKGPTGLKGDKGDKGDPGVSLFANVNGNDGSLTSGNAIGTTLFGTGVYEVTFDRDVSQCAGTASPGFNQGSLGVETGQAYVTEVEMGVAGKTSDSTTLDTVTVWIEDGTKYVPNDFHLIVVC